MWVAHHQQIQPGTGITTNRSLHYKLPDYSLSHKLKLIFLPSEILTVLLLWQNYALAFNAAETLKML